jgi:solute:Na+ symporter, SSS family
VIPPLPPIAAGVHAHFTTLDWGVLGGYLLLTTLVGHALRGKQATIRDFFLAGRSLPWPAVSASIIATEISALTFIGVPGLVFAAGGDFTYLQWAIGSVIARVIVGIWFTKVFYEQEIFSPYDFMALRLGPGVKALTTAMFTLGTILGQSVRVLVTALILRIVTPFGMTECILIITAFALVWTLMGGMTTVIWTDAMQFCLFVFSGLLALVWLVGGIQGGWPQLWQAAGDAGKLTLWNLSLDPDVQFTLWVALLAMPFQNLAAFGTDQLNAQRMFCCRNAADARKAIITSCLSQVVTVLMLLVGAGLFVWYQQHPPSPSELAAFTQDRDNVFPVWITTVLPPGLTGLVLAGAFAAAISSLDSALAALSQTSLSLLHGNRLLTHENPKALLLQSRAAVVIWAVVLCAAAFLLHAIKTHGSIDLVSLAFGMVAYTYGPMLGIFFLALARIPARLAGLWTGVTISILLTAAIRPDLYILLHNAGWIPEEVFLRRPTLSFVWLYPLTCLITLASGILLRRKAIRQ